MRHMNLARHMAGAAAVLGLTACSQPEAIQVQEPTAPEATAEAAPAPATPIQAADPALGAAVRHALGAEDGDRLNAVVARSDLNNDGRPEVLVYVNSPDYCGSGGCSLVVLTPEATGYRVVTKTTVTRAPVRVLPETSHGWRDLAVRVAGGGISGGDVRMSFDGVSYPRNPTTLPIMPDSSETYGETLIRQGDAAAAL